MVSGCVSQVCKLCFRKQAAGGFRRREPRRRAFGRCVRCGCTGLFLVVGHACVALDGEAPAAGPAASRRPRRHRQQLRRRSGGLRQRAGPCLPDALFRPQMLAEPRRPSRGAPVRPKCLGMIRPGRPSKAVDARGWRPRAQEPSGEHGLRGVARAFCACVREERKSFFFSAGFTSHSFCKISTWRTT